MDGTGSIQAENHSMSSGAGSPFWQHKSLSDLDEQEWESLCDGCGRCCLHKLEDEDTGEILYTRVACRMLDIARCRCSGYAHRRDEVPTCLDLRKGFTNFHWLPVSCAYRLRHEGKPLPEWHPLITGRQDSVHAERISVMHFAISELIVEDIEDYVIEDMEDFRSLIG